MPQLHEKLRLSRITTMKCIDFKLRGFARQAVALIFCLLASSLSSNAAEQEAAKSTYVFKETPLAKIPSSAQSGELKVSPDNQHIAVALQRNGVWSMCRDGVEAREYEEIRDLLWSPDSQHLSFVCRKSGRLRVVMDGKEGQVYKEIANGCQVFSPNSEHFAYIVRDNSKWIVVRDGKEGKEYDHIGKTGMFFSPDSQHLVYAVLQHQEACMVMDGKELLKNDGMGPISFSSDSKHLGYVVPAGERWWVVLDEKQREFHSVQTNGVIFSPDGQRLAFCAAPLNDKFRVYVDDKESTNWDFIGLGLLKFSPDSRRIAFAGRKGSEWFAEIDGVESKAYDGIMSESLVFSSNSQHVAFAALRGKKWLVVQDGREGKEYDGIVAQSLAFSPDSQHLAYFAGRDGKITFVFDSKETELSAVGSQKIAFSSDGQGSQLSCCVRIIGLQSQRLFQMEYRLIVSSFSDQGRSGKFLLVLGNQESQPYDQFMLSGTDANIFKSRSVIASRTDGKGNYEFMRLTAELPHP